MLRAWVCLGGLPPPCAPGAGRIESEEPGMVEERLISSMVGAEVS